MSRQAGKVDMGVEFFSDEQWIKIDVKIVIESKTVNFFFHAEEIVIYRRNG